MVNNSNNNSKKKFFEKWNTKFLNFDNSVEWSQVPQKSD